MGPVLSGCRSLRGSDRPPISKDRILPADTGTNPRTSADIVTGNPFAVVPRTSECKPAIPERRRTVVQEFRDVRGRKRVSRAGTASASARLAQDHRVRSNQVLCLDAGGDTGSALRGHEAASECSICRLGGRHVGAGPYPIRALPSGTSMTETVRRYSAGRRNRRKVQDVAEGVRRLQCRANAPVRPDRKPGEG